MARTEPEPAQLELITTDKPGKGRKVGRRRTGRHERAFDRAVRHAELDKLHALDAAISLGRALACGLDAAEAKGQGYELSQVAREYAAHLERLGLDGVGTGGDDDEDDELALDGPH